MGLRASDPAGHHGLDIMDGVDGGCAFRPWYRPGDFTESGRGPWECSPDADCLRLVRRYADQLLLVDEEEKGKFHLRVDNGYGVWRNDEARLTTLILGHRLRRTYFTPLSTFPGSGPGRR